MKSTDSRVQEHFDELKDEVVAISIATGTPLQRVTRDIAARHRNLNKTIEERLAKATLRRDEYR